MSSLAAIKHEGRSFDDDAQEKPRRDDEKKADEKTPNGRPLVVRYGDVVACKEYGLPYSSLELTTDVNIWRLEHFDSRKRLALPPTTSELWGPVRRVRVRDSPGRHWSTVTFAHDPEQRVFLALHIPENCGGHDGWFFYSVCTDCDPYEVEPASDLDESDTEAAQSQSECSDKTHGLSNVLPDDGPFYIIYPDRSHEADPTAFDAFVSGLFRK